MSWFVVRTKIGDEARAEEHLARQDYETYLPLILSDQRRKRDRLVEPMFTSYLFLSLTPGQDDFRPIESSRGVMGLIRFGGEPIPLFPGVIEALRAREDASGVHRIGKYDYSRGDPIRVETGPFKHLQGIFEAKSGRDRVFALLEILGETRRVEFRYHDIAPAA